MAALLEFVNGLVITSHALIGMQFLIHTKIKANLC